MARVTVEDCILNVPNRFDLVVLASQRAKQIASGGTLTVERDNDKDAVIALREIADKTIDLGNIQNEIVQGFCKQHTIESMEREVDKHHQSKEQDFQDEISKAFEDAKQFIAPGSKVPGEEGGANTPSFSDENLDVDD